MIFPTYSYILLVSFVIQIVLLILLIPRIQSRGAKFLAGLLAATAVWALAGAFEMAVVTEASKALWSAASYIGITTAPVFFFGFVLEYSRFDQIFPKKYFKYFWIIPVITIAGAFTNQWHHLVWTGFTWGPGNVMVYWYGPLFWINAFAVYLLLTSGIIVLFTSSFRHQGLYRLQLLAITMAALFPFAANMIYLLKIPPLEGLDFTPASFCLTAGILTYILVRYSFLDLVPISHNQLFQNIKAGILVLDHKNRVLELNGFIETILGIDDSSIGKSLDLLGIKNRQFVNICSDNHYYEGDLAVDIDGCKNYFNISISEIFDSNSLLTGKLIVLYDISVQKKNERELVRVNSLLEDRLFEIEKLHERLEYQALRDPLTGLYNRRYFDEALKKEFSRSVRENTFLGICIIDIDNFKIINDSYGHSTGDRILILVSEVIQGKIRKTDYVCRYGGDELVVLMPKIGRDVLYERAEAFRRAVAALDMSEYLNEENITVSQGVVIFPEDGDDYDSLLKSADLALNESKKKGRNCTSIMKSKGD